MLLPFVRSFVRGFSKPRERAARPLHAAPLRLHIGGRTAHADWKILDVRPGPGVDFVGHCADLSAFDNETVAEIYASHVIEHLSHKHGVAATLCEFHRVLVPGGPVRIGVPDLPTLCALYLDPKLNSEDRYQVIRMIYGGQLNPADYHYAGFDEESLTSRLHKAGFVDVVRVPGFGLFDDTSNHVFKGKPISLNLLARKPPAV
jgi:predicted SAM-dependent methyltransferase